MTECPGLDVVLARLMERRGLGVTALAGQAGVPEAELRAVLGGATPGQAQFRRLGPALGIHKADLLAIAWADLPEDLAPLDPRAAWLLPHLAGHAARLPPEHVRELRERVRLMPQRERPQPTRPPRPARQPPRSPGGMLLRLLTNRNMEHSAGYAIWAVSGRVLSGSTPALAGHGRKELTRGELADYISVLDISAEDLSVMTGVDLLAPVPRTLPGTAETARLIWDVRRLTADQVRHVCDMAESRRQELGALSTAGKTN
jgi:hypothetical protein